VDHAEVSDVGDALVTLVTVVGPGVAMLVAAEAGEVPPVLVATTW
jgi:hypothetical protein